MIPEQTDKNKNNNSGDFAINLSGTKVICYGIILYINGEILLFLLILNSLDN